MPWSFLVAFVLQMKGEGLVVGEMGVSGCWKLVYQMPNNMTSLSVRVGLVEVNRVRMDSQWVLETMREMLPAGNRRDPDPRMNSQISYVDVAGREKHLLGLGLHLWIVYDV